MDNQERKDPRKQKTYWMRASVIAVIDAEAERLDVSASEALRKIIAEWAAAHETQTPR